MSKEPKRLISLIGSPGCGKTAVGKGAAKLLATDYIASGDVARAVCQQTGDDRLARGEMGPEDLVRKGMAEAIRASKHDVIIVDGMPRSYEQLKWFRAEFSDFDLRFVHIDVPRVVCQDRLMHRNRVDDKENLIVKRLQEYEVTTLPMLEQTWHSRFRPAPFASEELVTIDFCKFLLSDRVIQKRVKIKLLPEHPLFGMSEEQVAEAIKDSDVARAFLFKKYAGDAGLDLFVTRPVVIPARGKVNISTSIQIEIPPFYWYAIDKRSSTFYTRDMLVIEAVIDNGYRGELYCTVHNPGDAEKVIGVGESLAQIIFHELVGYDFVCEVASELSPSDRGVNGFGSTTDHKVLIENLYSQEYDIKTKEETA